MSVVLGALAVGALALTLAHYVSILVWALLSARFLDRGRSSVRPVASSEGAETAGVSIICPAYNEEVVIAYTVRSALRQEHDPIEVIVVNDGSTDRTVEVLEEAFDLEEIPPELAAGPIPTEEVRRLLRSSSDPRVVVVDKEPSGAKADGANAGINVARHPWIVVMDGDELLEPDVLRRCMTDVRHADTSGGRQVVCVGTSLLPTNGCKVKASAVTEARVPGNLWAGCQLIEYSIAFLMARPGMAEIGALPIISGGFGVFRREVVLECGGFVHGHLGEDMDLCLRIQELVFEGGGVPVVIQVPEAICWTEFPGSRQVLRKQRIRWHRGLRQIIAGHRRIIGNPRYGNVGLFGMPTLYVFEWWGPIIEAVGWLSLLWLVATGGLTATAVGLAILTQLVGLAVAFTAAIRLLHVFPDRYSAPGDIRRLLLWCVVVGHGFRQLTLVWRIRSLFPGGGGWGEMTRQGFVDEAESVGAA